MMKRYLKLLTLLLFSGNLLAQTYGNEWINYSQQYYSFNIYATGVQRIDQSVLASAGVPTGTFSSENIQIFGREKEVPLYIVDGNDNSFDPGDYILFYAEKNDGWLDSLVYADPTHIANAGLSMFSDTIKYFFTWNNQTNNARFVVETDVDFASYGTPPNYIIKEIESSCPTVFTGYSEGMRSGYSSGSIYAPGEGWGCTSVSLGTQYDTYMPTFEVYSGAGVPNSELHFTITSNSSPAHHLHVSLGSSNAEMADSIFNGFEFHRYNRSISTSLLSAPFTTLRLQSIDDLNSNADLLSMNYWRLRYPKVSNFQFQNLDEFDVIPNPSFSKSLLNITSNSSINAIAFSFGSVNRVIPVVQNFITLQLLVPNDPSGSNTHVVLANAANVIPVAQVTPVNGNGTFTDFSALSMEEALLMVYHPKLQSSTSDYANYRSSIAGGSYNVVLANIEELYLQYSGGIPKHSLATRRFALHSYDLATQKPVGLFLLGKGISEVDSNARFVPSIMDRSLIPSFGYPCSDIAITSGLNGTYWEPLIPTGRISAATNSELSEYLDKVVLYESQQVQNDPINYSMASKNWQKQILHFVGGADQAQQDSFQSYMNGMKNIIEDSLFAGNVTSYFKTSSDPLDPVVVSGVNQQIANGVSLMNFFGHAAASNNGFEINIDEPANWNNYGKYPVVIGNSCYNGNIFSRSYNSTSERFVNIPDAGAIAFISSVSVGYDYPLNQYSNRLYREFSYLNYGGTIGQQMKSTIQYIQTLINSSLLYETTCQQMTLHGDPMLRLNWHERPEIEIRNQDLYVEPAQLNLTVDSIELNLIINNIGQSVTDTFRVEIVRDFPGTTIDSTYELFLPYLNYNDTIHLKMPLQPDIGVGVNQFSISVDLPSQIAEQAEEVNNNRLDYNFFLNIDGILPVYPYDFAVVPYDNVTVKASTINPIASMKTYLFQLDTVDTYDSPQFRQYSMTELGGVKEVRPNQWRDINNNSFPLVCTDSTVYFWRVAVDSSVINWVEYSFQYIPGKTGWGQDHFFQFKKNDFYNITYNRLNRLREFSPPDTHSISVSAYDNNSIYNSWSFDGEIVDYATIWNTTPAIFVGVMDPLTLQPWGSRFLTTNPDHAFGNGNDNPDGVDLTICPECRTRYENFFSFVQSDPAQLSALQNMIENEIPDGYYVAVYSTIATEYSNWDTYQPGLYTMFQNLGSTGINSGQSTGPFAAFFQKGDPATYVEAFYPADAVTDFTGPHVEVSGPVYSSSNTGIERTPLIGPALEWQTVYWKRDSIEMAATDSVRLYLEAHDISGTLQMTIDTVFSPNDSIMVLNNLIDAATYPYLRLGIFYADPFFNTPAQVDRLHVLYQPVPEAAIDGTSAYYMSPNPDSLQEGQTISFAVDVRNISHYDMDSILVNYWIEDIDRVRHDIAYPRQKVMPAFDLLRDTITFSTEGYAGSNIFWMEVNPYINGSQYVTDQPEQYHFNNLLQIPFNVTADDEHPILDVTFDGRHILNGDIISPESEIYISLKDDNPYLIMDDISDTTLFGVYLTDPAGVQRRIPFMDGNGNTVMQWIPAEAQNKKFKIIYPAYFEMDGKYSLIVQGSDRSGNVSGDIEYRVTFEIVHESSITYMMNYPNPFSTSTRFVFTLTGNDVPDELIIQIMTVSGRVVREITEDELGPITIGRNITQYAWDGTDEFGDKLANGVYLYRVKAKINGEDIKHRESGADTHFKEEFGKMYLMR